MTMYLNIIMKKIDLVQHTIDKKHSQMLEEFHKNESLYIPELLSQKKSLKIQLRSLNSDQIEEYMEIKDQISIIDINIKDLKLHKKNICWTILSIFSTILKKKNNINR